LQLLLSFGEFFDFLQFLGRHFPSAKTEGDGRRHR